MKRAKLLDHVRGLAYATLPTEIRNGIPEGVRLMGAPLFWQAGIDGRGILIGNIDTGVDSAHPDLQTCTDGSPKIRLFRDYVNGDGSLQPGSASYDDHIHGSHTAGTQAANGSLKGVAPGAQLAVYKCLNKDGGGRVADVTRAITDAVADGCRILSMSLGVADGRVILEWADAITAAVAANRLVPVAAGNSGNGTTSYPATHPDVISVGAVWYDPETGRLEATYFSAGNPEVDVAAHGYEVVSTLPGGGYGAMSGTSMACPHVAGYAALILQRGDARLGQPMTEVAGWEGIKSSTIPLDRQNQTGAGFVTIYPTFPVRRRLQLMPDNPSMLVQDGNAPSVVITLDVPAQIVDGRLRVPLRKPFEAAGARVVEWNQNTQTATADFYHIKGMDD